MTQELSDEPDTPLELAHARLVAAINGQPPGSEADYLARLALLLLNELGCSERALALIESARGAVAAHAGGADAPGPAEPRSAGHSPAR